MKTVLTSLTVTALTFCAVTCHAKLNVIATTPDIAAIAKEIGGDQVEITTLTRPTEDPTSWMPNRVSF